MDWLDLAKSGIGAIIGFALAQFINIAKLWHQHYRRPILQIEVPEENCRFLKHSTEVNRGELLDEEIYGFSVRNVGKTIAKGVRFQIISLGVRKEGESDYRSVIGHAMDLAIYEVAARIGKTQQTSLIPNAAVRVGLAAWREDSWAVIPLTQTVPDYYEEICADADEYKFSVATFDDSGRAATAELLVRS